MDDINRVTGEDDLNKNSLGETETMETDTGASDMGTDTGALDTSGTSFNERLDSDLDSDAAGFDETAGDAQGQDENLIDKAKDKYREIMSDDK